jgi:nicotinamide-nucleotide amidase
MDLELVTIGTELLLGFTVDSNAADIARALAPVGARLVRRTTVADDGEAITAAVREALTRTGFVITTGGLGPTRDDISKHAIAALFGMPLELDQAYLERLRQRFEQLGRGPMPESNRTQAEVPRGAVVLTNQWGTAPGLWLEGKPGVAVLLPGVPREARGLIEHEVVPRIRERVARAHGAPVVTLSRTLRTTGIGESALADRIGALEERIAPVTLAYLPGPDGVDLRLTAWGVPPAEAAHLLARAAETLMPPLGAHHYGDDGCDLAALVLERLEQRGLKLAVAESCTGGVLGERITAIPGASRTFVGGVMAYANEVKVSALGVPEALMAQHGAVSEPVVRAMAEGAARRFQAGATLAATGIAGPSGGTPEKPVGTVWLAACLDGRCESIQRRLVGDRGEIRRRAAQAALDLLRRMLGPGSS